MEDKINRNSESGPAGSREPETAIHYADNGPDLESCMISILSSHMSGSGEERP